MAWVNVNSLLGRADELRVFLDHESHKEIDSLVLNETKLDPTIHHNENQASKYRAKTGKGGGGVAIYHRANFNSGSKSRSFNMINIDSHLTNCLMTILKANLMSLINKHAPLSKKNPLGLPMTYYVACLPNYLAKIKKKNRNDADNLIRAVKRKYFTENLDA